MFTISRVNQAAKAVAERVRVAMKPERFPAIHILVVNDHPDAADAMAAVLSQLGCHVRVCYSGASAVATAANFEPDVCVLDSMIPGMDGIDLASSLKSQAADRPLILVATTGYEEGLLENPVAVSGYQFLLVRPFDVATLIETLVRLGQIAASRSTDD